MATLKDIARKTGFSLSVVSRALNHNPDQRVAPETKLKIEAAVRELDYRRNHAASQLARGKSVSIGVFLPNYGYSLIADLVIGMSEAAAAHDFQCNFYFGLDSKDYLQFIESAKTSGSAGLLSYLWSDISAPIVHEAVAHFQRDGGQALLLNAAPLRELGIDSVNIDNYAGGRLAAEYLLAQGCEEFCCLTTAESWQTSQRLSGFVDTVRGQGHDPRKHVVGHTGFHKYADLDLDRLLAGVERPVGIFALSDYLAMEVLRLLAQRGHAEEVGKRIRVIGYDNVPGSQHTYPALTTVEQPFREFGRYGMGQLLHLITGTTSPSSALPAPKLIVRESA